MTLAKHVFDATAENFSTLVLENSRRGLVVVNFWTPKAGPCMILMPRLVKLASEYGGRFLLVMLNTDELGTLARRMGVTSVPTVKFFRNGEVVHSIYGAEPDATFRQALSRFLDDNSVQLHDQGLAAWQNGNIDRARDLLVQAAMENPSDATIPRDLAKILWSSGDGAQALALLDSLPPSIRCEPEIENLYCHLLLARTAQTSPDRVAIESVLLADPDNFAARYQLAARSLAEDQIEQALDALLEIVRRDRHWQNGQASKALTHLLDWLGSGHPLVARYREALDDLAC
ncbi:MAG: tetratricopeptide repeat protein [Thiobacillaceae bacterium]